MGDRDHERLLVIRKGIRPAGPALDARVRRARREAQVRTVRNSGRMRQDRREDDHDNGTQQQRRRSHERRRHETLPGFRRVFGLLLVQARQKKGDVETTHQILQNRVLHGRAIRGPKQVCVIRSGRIGNPFESRIQTIEVSYKVPLAAPAVDHD